MPYHWHNGFNNQAIIGAHTANNLRPTYKDRWLAQQMVLNHAILITNADNLDSPNVMLGDMISYSISGIQKSNAH